MYRPRHARRNYKDRDSDGFELPFKFAALAPRGTWACLGPMLRQDPQKRLAQSGYTRAGDTSTTKRRRVPIPPASYIERARGGAPAPPACPKEGHVKDVAALGPGSGQAPFGRRRPIVHEVCRRVSTSLATTFIVLRHRGICREHRKEQEKRPF